MGIVTYSEYIEGEKTTGEERMRHIEVILDAIKRGGAGEKIEAYNLMRWHSKLFPYGGTFRTCMAMSAGSGHVYTDPEKIWRELDGFFKTFDFKKKSWSSIAEAHYILCRIHPFPDGNGRIARTFTNWHAMYAGYHPTRLCHDREKYIRALENKDILALNILMRYNQIHL